MDTMLVIILIASALLISFSMGGLAAMWYTSKAVDDAIYGKSGYNSRNRNP